jgi:environmental stress-induced protein Ves
MWSDSAVAEPPLPPGVRLFTLEEIDSEPWRNGGGRTRTVAASSLRGELVWRISAADIDADGDFSAFDGMDRTAVLMRGEGLALRLTDETLRLPRVGTVVRFPGEVPVRARLAGAPARLWNVMVRRGLAQVDTQVLGMGSIPVLPGEAQEVVMVVLSGRVQVRALDSRRLLRVLSAGQGLVCSGSRAGLMLVGLAAIDALDEAPCWVRSALQTGGDRPPQSTLSSEK